MCAPCTCECPSLHIYRTPGILLQTSFDIRRWWRPLTTWQSWMNCCLSQLKWQSVTCGDLEFCQSRSGEPQWDLGDVSTIYQTRISMEEFHSRRASKGHHCTLEQQWTSCIKAVGGVPWGLANQGILDQVCIWTQQAGYCWVRGIDTSFSPFIFIMLIHCLEWRSWHWAGFLTGACNANYKAEFST